MLTFEKFNDIENLSLQVFNRVIYLTTLVADYGQSAAKQYLETFNKGEQAQMTIMGMYIKAKGKDFVRKQITHGIEVVEDEPVHNHTN